MLSCQKIHNFNYFIVLKLNANWNIFWNDELTFRAYKEANVNKWNDYKWGLPIHQGNSGISVHACLKMYIEF